MQKRLLLAASATLSIASLGVFAQVPSADPVPAQKQCAGLSGEALNSCLKSAPGRSGNAASRMGERTPGASENAASRAGTPPGRQPDALHGRGAMEPPRGLSQERK